MTDKEKLLKSKIREQKKLIKRLKNMVKTYAPYMSFPDENRKQGNYLQQFQEQILKIYL